MKLEKWFEDCLVKYLSLTPEQRKHVIVRIGRTNGKLWTMERLRKAIAFKMWYNHQKYTKAKRIMLRKKRGWKI